jgi:hypothetical protein
MDHLLNYTVLGYLNCLQFISFPKSIHPSLEGEGPGKMGRFNLPVRIRHEIILPAAHAVYYDFKC